MRRIMLLGLLVLLVPRAPAQRRGGGEPASRIGGGRAGASSPFFRPGRPVYRSGYGYGYLPYSYGYDDYGFAPQAPAYFAPPSLVVPSLETPEPLPREAHAVITNYNPPAPAASATPAGAQAEAQAFAIVLRDGSTLSATTVIASGGVLHYVSPDERHMQIALAEVDRDATLRLNRERKLILHLP